MSGPGPSSSFEGPRESRVLSPTETKPSYPTRIGDEAGRNLLLRTPIPGRWLVRRRHLSEVGRVPGKDRRGREATRDVSGDGPERGGGPK